MADWIIQEVLSFLTARGALLNASALTGSHFTVYLENNCQLQLDFDPHEESLLMSMRVMVDVYNTYVLQRALEQNANSHLNKFSPTGHLFNDHLVLRERLFRHTLQSQNLETVLSNMMRFQERLTEAY
ncbi:MAG: hypothetical protein HWE26_17690 [Alteromonadaceae bacterium]|nr:hypothetical protein [Alteromonadaceae bacterium]